MRNLIAISGIAVILVVVAGLLRWRAIRRSREHDLPPLFFPLAKANEGRPPILSGGMLTSVHGMRAAATPEPLAETNVPQRIATVSPPTGGAPVTAAHAQDNRNTEEQRSNVANPTTESAPGIAAAAPPQVVNNGLGAASTNIASNGASSAHVANGRGGGISFVPPNVHRPNIPPHQINTPTHLKVVRDTPDFANEHAPAPDETVRFRRPTEEAVQLLPGRLQVVSGDPRHQEIRFVRIPGRPAELILGREPGDTAQHVALNSSTVSRKHARFAFQEGRWHVSNLSQTNPVVVNGEELSAYDNARPLTDGDQIELGEVVLRFRSH